MPRRKKKSDPANRRLDQFLTRLQIEQEKKEQILQYVEGLTFETLKRKSAPQLRLTKIR